MLVLRSLAFVIGCALLASCGGGDSSSTPPSTGGGGGGGGTPTPSPSPSPSPTPTYQTVAQLTGDQRFATSCAFFNFSRQISPNFRADSVFMFAEQAELRFTAGNSTWSFVETAQTNPADQRTFTFGPADLVASPPANTVLYRRAAGAGQLGLALRNGQQSGFTTDYLRVVSLTEIASLALPDPDRSDRLCVYGVPMVAADTFPAGTTSYNSINVAGTATLMNSAQRVATYSLRDSTATFAVNGAAGTVSMTIQLVGREILADGTLAATTTPLPALTAGTGNITNAGTPGLKVFDGNFTTGGFQELTSGFAGAFFGPQGSEAGFSFRTKPLTGTPNEGLEIAGVVIARR